MSTAYRKRAIPQAVRREIALRAGCVPLQRGHAALCHYCGAVGSINWMTSSWVHFADLELDHVHPELHGGEATADNIVLAYRSCNRRKGHRILEGL